MLINITEAQLSKLEALIRHASERLRVIRGKRNDG
jgi:hypothetical protein